MKDFAPNRIVLVPCEKVAEREGGDYGVIIATGGVPVEGVVGGDTLMTSGGRVYARAAVTRAKSRAITVWIPGSFSNSDGQVSLRREWAVDNVLTEDRRPADADEGAALDRAGKRPPYWGHGWFYEA